MALRIGGWIKGRSSEWMDRRMDIFSDGWTEVRLMDGWMDGWCGWMDGWVD